MKYFGLIANTQIETHAPTYLTMIELEVSFDVHSAFPLECYQDKYFGTFEGCYLYFFSGVLTNQLIVHNLHLSTSKKTNKSTVSIKMRDTALKVKAPEHGVADKVKIFESKSSHVVSTGNFFISFLNIHLRCRWSTQGHHSKNI